MQGAGVQGLKGEGVGAGEPRQRRPPRQLSTIALKIKTREPSLLSEVDSVALSDTMYSQISFRNTTRRCTSRPQSLHRRRAHSKCSSLCTRTAAYTIYTNHNIYNLSEVYNWQFKMQNLQFWLVAQYTIWAFCQNCFETPLPMVQEDHDATPHFAAVKAFTDGALAKSFYHFYLELYYT